MEYVTIVAILALLQYFWFGLRVATMRVRHGIKAPAVTGHLEFERNFRVQQNTTEQLVLFLPALALYAHYVNPLWAAGLGAVWVVGRFIYRAEYLKDPTTRSLGFAITALPTIVMLIWVVIRAVMLLVR
jgi:glutathione S-transferase